MKCKVTTSYLYIEINKTCDTQRIDDTQTVIFDIKHYPLRSRLEIYT